MTAEDYLRRVDVAVRDLPWRTRRELNSELRGHLAELPADTDFVERLGTPERYAADLRSAAGLERRRGPIAFLRARRPRNRDSRRGRARLDRARDRGRCVGAGRRADWLQRLGPIPPRLEDGTHSRRLLPGRGFPQRPTVPARRSDPEQWTVRRTRARRAVHVGSPLVGEDASVVRPATYGHGNPRFASLPSSRPAVVAAGIRGPSSRSVPSTSSPGNPPSCSSRASSPTVK